MEPQKVHQSECTEESFKFVGQSPGLIFMDFHFYRFIGHNFVDPFPWIIKKFIIYWEFMGISESPGNPQKIEPSRILMITQYMYWYPRNR